MHDCMKSTFCTHLHHYEETQSNGSFSFMSKVYQYLGHNLDSFRATKAWKLNGKCIYLAFQRLHQQHK